MRFAAQQAVPLGFIIPVAKSFFLFFLTPTLSPRRGEKRKKLLVNHIKYRNRKKLLAIAINKEAGPTARPTRKTLMASRL
jgi:hypothetical protein